MNVLLDTHTLIWGVDSPARLSRAAAMALQDPTNMLFVSAASIWEMGIKVGLGRLPLSQPFRKWVDDALLALEIQLIPIMLDDIERYSVLPLHHGDPFDRMIIAQSLRQALPIVGNDVQFDAYGVTRIWN